MNEPAEFLASPDELRQIEADAEAYDAHVQAIVQAALALKGGYGFSRRYEALENAVESYRLHWGEK
jgi:hypothetical protein